jgi:hypothetical protein
MPVERHALFRGLRAQRRHRDAEQRVGAEPAFRGGPVEGDHRFVERSLRVLAPGDRARDFAVHVRDGGPHAFAPVARPVTVTQFERFTFAGRRARRHRGAPERAALERDVDFDRRIAPRIQNFAAVHPRNIQATSTVLKATTKSRR